MDLLGFTIQAPKTPLRRGRVIILIAVLIAVGLYVAQFITVGERREYLGFWVTYEKTSNGTEIYTFQNEASITVLSDPSIDFHEMYDDWKYPHVWWAAYYYDLVYSYNIYGTTFLISVEVARVSNEY